jgi:hypothetical protein
VGKLDTFQPTYTTHIYEEGAIYIPELPGETRLNDRELYIYYVAFTLGMEAAVAAMEGSKAAADFIERLLAVEGDI